jgi:glycosyltransferase involved in cell wall biosynthesis
VSVCIPTYNYGHVLPDAIESVLGQTFTDFEIVVVDNCSTDGTEEIAARYLRQDGRVRYFRNEANVGMVGNWNRCLQYARGEFVKILCADDLLAPACLEESVRLLTTGTAVSLAASARRIVSQDLSTVLTKRYADRVLSAPGKEIIHTCLEKGNLIGEPTAVMFRRNQAARGFDDRYVYIVDLEMWLHLLEQGDFAFTPQELCSIRLHGGQETVGAIATLAFADDEHLLLDEYVGKNSMQNGLYAREKIRFMKALTIWKNTVPRHPRVVALDLIARRYNRYLFLVLLMLKTVVQRVFRLGRPPRAS